MEEDRTWGGSRVGHGGGQFRDVQAGTRWELRDCDPVSRAAKFQHKDVSPQEEGCPLCRGPGGASICSTH